jgi:protein disulfide-isomerase
MRLLPLSLLFAIFAPAVLADAPEQRLGSIDTGEITSASEDGIEELPIGTTFNGVKVPPLPEIDGEKFASTVKDGYWFVKHHS